MKKKTNIRQVIRTIVREEVAMAIGEVITELKQPTQQVSKPKYKKKVVEGKRKYQKFTENSVLNDVLNETAQSDDWKKVDSEPEVKSVQDNTEQLPDHLANALNKDYSEVLKKVDEKAKFKNGA